MRAGLCYGALDDAAVRRHVACVEDTQALRDALPGLGLVAFVGDGSVLPRCGLPHETCALSARRHARAEAAHHTCTRSLTGQRLGGRAACPHLTTAVLTGCIRLCTPRGGRWRRHQQLLLPIVVHQPCQKPLMRHAGSPTGLAAGPGRICLMRNQDCPKSWQYGWHFLE